MKTKDIGLRFMINMDLHGRPESISVYIGGRDHLGTHIVIPVKDMLLEQRMGDFGSIFTSEFISLSDVIKNEKK